MINCQWNINVKLIGLVQINHSELFGEVLFGFVFFIVSDHLSDLIRPLNDLSIQSPGNSREIILHPQQYRYQLHGKLGPPDQC